MEVRAFVLLALCWACPAAAQQVYKCVDGGNTVYQSDPCATGQAVKRWDAVPEAPNAHGQARLDAIQRELDARRRSEARVRPPQGAVSGAAISQYRDPHACATAKAQRAAAFEAAGSRRTFELTRQMDDRVFDACK